ncbi:MAG: hypothetical protein HY881_03400 [Deltaproteobacteria bacterium]|nr:hypothetical protein [Deltaproteobacteria bacterium]
MLNNIVDYLAKRLTYVNVKQLFVDLVRISGVVSMARVVEAVVPYPRP